MSKKTNLKPLPHSQESGKNTGILLDNQKQSVGNYLKDKINTSSVLNMVSAYFTIYGFKSMEEELNKPQEINFLYGDPSGIGTVDPKISNPKVIYLMKMAAWS